MTGESIRHAAYIDCCCCEYPSLVWSSSLTFVTYRCRSFAEERLRRIPAVKTTDSYNPRLHPSPYCLSQTGLFLLPPESLLITLRCFALRCVALRCVESLSPRCAASSQTLAKSKSNPCWHFRPGGLQKSSPSRLVVSHADNVCS